MLNLLIFFFVKYMQNNLKEVHMRYYIRVYVFMR